MADDLEALTSNLFLVDEIYARYRSDPGSVDPSWRALFENGGRAAALAPAVPAPAPASTPAEETPARAREGASAAAAPRMTLLPTPVAGVPLAAWDLDVPLLASAIQQLLTAYRTVGHLAADLDPLGMRKIDVPAELDPTSYGLTGADLARMVPLPGSWGEGGAPLGEIIAHLRQTYARTVGAELMHISSPGKRAWLCEHMERARPPYVGAAVQTVILEQLATAEGFERFIHAKYVGTKRFSLEGSETLIPLVDLVMEHAGASGVVEAVLGMAHRGRLNVLTNVVGKRASEVFAEFEDIEPESTLGAGDVKYHLGYSRDHVTRAGHRIHLSLAFNPSHLEAVDPVVVGRVRAKQQRLRDPERRKALGVLIHGDAAFAGQGLVPETLNLSELHGYRTGGTVHVIVNNQIGFTTPPEDSRSTRYCTDVAKMLECPIFHVNGEDPEAVAHVVRVAMEYRETFGNDVVIDLFGYRRYGHNEADEPSFTQPLLYRRIENKRSVFALYAERLVKQGVITQAAVDQMVARIAANLGREWSLARAAERRPSVPTLRGVWQGYSGGPSVGQPDVDTGFEAAQLTEIARRITTLPAGFHAHRKISRLLEHRAAMGRGERPIDWAMAELLAFGTLASEGTLVRLSGQDSGRGTFSQRHAVITDMETGADHIPLAVMSDQQAPFRVYDSPLSEAAVLGFEFGYSLDYPDALILWEAQFGDFVNGAQVLIDQFVSSSEDKWRRMSGLTLLLPHAFEGQGPEHSSARFERFLQLAAEDNLQVCFPTTPAQYFHLLRRQVLRPWRKPLVVMTPKGLLRLPTATSTLAELATGRFQRVLPDPTPPPAAGVRRAVLCTGKLFYDLAEERHKRSDQSTTILRIEELYPWRPELLTRALEGLGALDEILWVQEEPANMGALQFVEPRLRSLFAGRVRAIARPESASPATGSSKAHQIEQRALLEEAFR